LGDSSYNCNPDENSNRYGNSSRNFDADQDTHTDSGNSNANTCFANGNSDGDPCITTE
jgi:hypothetical protein